MPGPLDHAATARPGAPYVTAGGREYIIVPVYGGWRVRPWAGGRTSRAFKSVFTTWDRAERFLIQHLRDTDSIINRAVYPGCKPRRKW